MKVNKLNLVQMYSRKKVAVLQDANPRTAGGGFHGRARNVRRQTVIGLWSNMKVLHQI
jgi:hypothetical protein